MYFGGTNQDMGVFEDQGSFREEIRSAGMQIGLMYGISVSQVAGCQEGSC